MKHIKPFDENKKLLLLTVFLFSHAFSLAQHNREPTFYLNDSIFNYDKVYLNPKIIDSIRVEKETEIRIRGKSNLLDKFDIK